MTPFQFSEPASTELTEAIRWYEQQRSGLGGDLFDAIVATIDLIRTHPEIGAARGGRLPSRQLRVHRFPYNVVYRIVSTTSMLSPWPMRAGTRTIGSIASNQESG